MFEADLLKSDSNVHWKKKIKKKLTIVLITYYETRRKRHENRDKMYLIIKTTYLTLFLGIIVRVNSLGPSANNLQMDT